MAISKNKLQSKTIKLLSEYIAIKSISSEDKSKEMQKAVQWLQRLFEKYSFTNIKLLTAEKGYPSVYADKIFDNDKPTILLYGHMDVQPVNLDKWKTDPFKLELKNNYLYGRGVSDNKTQHFIPITELGKIIKSGKELDYNIKIIIEGNEETGSTGFEQIVKENANLLKSDLVVVLDGKSITEKVPTIFNSGKGIIVFRLVILGASKEYHSGYFGGIIVNPAIALGEFISNLYDSEGKLSINGELLKNLSNNIQYKNKKIVQKQSNIAEPLYNQNLIDNQKNMATCDIHSIKVGDIQNLKTSIPNKAEVVFSIRKVQKKSSKFFFKEIENKCKDIIKCRWGLNYNFDKIADVEPFIANMKSSKIKRIVDRINNQFEESLKVTSLSATQPAVSILQKYISSDTIMIGFAPPDSNAHSVNEKIHLNAIRNLKLFAQALDQK